MKKRREGAKSVKNAGHSDPKGGLAPEYVAYFFVCSGSTIIGRLYALTPTYEAKVTLQLTVSLSDLV